MMFDLIRSKSYPAGVMTHDALHEKEGIILLIDPNIVGHSLVSFEGHLIEYVQFLFTSGRVQMTRTPYV